MFVRSRSLRSLTAALVVLLALALTACNGNGGGTPSPPTGGSPAPGGNLLVNPGLEQGPEPWLTHTTNVNSDPKVHFVVSQDQTRSGTASALLHMQDGLQDEGARVYYLVQEVTPDEFPEVVSGYYRVNGWQRGTPKQYLQFVVIVFGADNSPVITTNFQIRYILAGIDSPPFALGNAQFLFLSKDQPVQDEWIPFQVNVREDFQRLWNTVPEGFEKIRLLFEVRWDAKVIGDGAPQADVFYDDLYVGPASGG